MFLSFDIPGNLYFVVFVIQTTTQEIRKRAHCIMNNEDACVLRRNNEITTISIRRLLICYLIVVSIIVIMISESPSH